MIRVQFQKGWRMYQPGEVAAFDQLIADQLVKTGIAALVDDTPSEAPKVSRKAKTAGEAQEEGGER